MKNRKQSNGKTARCVICCVLAAALLFGSGVLGYFTHKWTKGEAPETTAAGQGGMVIGSSDGYGIALVSAEIPLSQYDEYGIMPAAESAQTVTATLKDYAGDLLYEDDAERVQLTWTLTWKTNSGWGNGKSVAEYVSLSTSENTHTATLSCLQPFGEQLVLKAAVKDNDYISNTATVDYRQKYSSWSATIKFPPVVMPHSIISDTGTIVFGENLVDHTSRIVITDFPALLEDSAFNTKGGSIQFNVIGTDVYTLPLEFSVGGCETKCAYPQQISQAGGYALEDYTALLDPQYDAATHTWNNLYLYSLFGLGSYNDAAGFTVKQYRSALSKLGTEVEETPISAVSYRFINVKVNGQPVTSSDEFTFSVLFNKSTLYAAASSVELDHTGLEF